jgi:hypothetical protein
MKQGLKFSGGRRSVDHLKQEAKQMKPHETALA